MWDRAGVQPKALAYAPTAPTLDRATFKKHPLRSEVFVARCPHSTSVTHFLPELLADVLDQLLEEAGKNQERSSCGPRTVGGVVSSSAEPLEEGGIGRFFQGRPEQLPFELL